MKTRYLIGIFLFIIVITMHFVAAGMAGSQSQLVTENLVIKKAIPSQALQNTLTSGDQLEPDGSIFSRSTIIYLIVAVIGIVAFRRNTYS
jgi:hypothetical protein